MIRHLLIAAFRNMAANRLLSAISIMGLAVGIAVAILMGLVVRNQMRFDHFIPGHTQTQTASASQTRQHPGANLIVVMKGEDEVRPAFPGKRAVRSALPFEPPADPHEGGEHPSRLAGRPSTHDSTLKRLSGRS